MQGAPLEAMYTLRQHANTAGRRPMRAQADWWRALDPQHQVAPPTSVAQSLRTRGTGVDANYKRE